MITDKKQTKTRLFIEKYGDMMVYLVLLVLLGAVFLVLFFPLLSLEKLRENFLFFKEIQKKENEILQEKIRKLKNTF